MSTIPGEKAAQYRLNFIRATASVVVARVSVRWIDIELPAGSERRVQAILT